MHPSSKAMLLLKIKHFKTFSTVNVSIDYFFFYLILQVRGLINGGKSIKNIYLGHLFFLYHRNRGV